MFGSMLYNNARALTSYVLNVTNFELRKLFLGPNVTCMDPILGPSLYEGCCMDSVLYMCYVVTLYVLFVTNIELRKLFFGP